MKTLIHSARLLAPMDDARRRLPDGWLLIDGARIAALGAGPPPAEVAGPATRRIDATGKVVLPGFVNTHHHLPQTLTRNVP